ncbi:hypothetical protein [Geobacillus thermoleovorans]|nr:hypothetical protein [Geobacillus thermoleovorans]MBW7642407.1 hypothetical protein [Geobacillus thermoleovorans]
MIYLYDLQKVTDTDYIVCGYHMMPFDEKYGLGKTKAQLEAEGGIFVDDLPQREYHEGKTPILHINPRTKEMWYEYQEVRNPITDEVDTLKERIALMQQVLDDLILGGM